MALFFLSHQHGLCCFLLFYCEPVFGLSVLGFCRNKFFNMADSASSVDMEAHSKETKTQLVLGLFHTNTDNFGNRVLKKKKEISVQTRVAAPFQK